MIFININLRINLFLNTAIVSLEILFFSTYSLLPPKTSFSSNGKLNFAMGSKVCVKWLPWFTAIKSKLFYFFDQTFKRSFVGLSCHKSKTLNCKVKQIWFLHSFTPIFAWVFCMEGNIRANLSFMSDTSKM